MTPVAEVAGSGLPDIGDVVEAGPVIPVVVIEDPAHAVPLANALQDNGIRVIEVTLRTPQALESVSRIATECPNITVGVGSVRRHEHVEAAVAAGAQFLVTPGSPPGLLSACEASGLPLLPGAGTITEMLALAERGYGVVKFFPAEQLGGVAALRAIAGPLADLQVCPTGGITIELAPQYLQLPTVPCVGASWVTPVQALREGDWDTVRRLARRARELSRVR